MEGYQKITVNNVILVLAWVLSGFSCVQLFATVDCSPAGLSVHGILQARMLEWVPISFSGGSSQPKDGTPAFCVSFTDRQVLYH